MCAIDQRNQTSNSIFTGAATGTSAFIALDTAQRTAGFFSDLHTKLDNLTPINPYADRAIGVRQSWQWEKLEVGLGGPGTHPWTGIEKRELLGTGHVYGYEGHHINSVGAHPELAGHPDNIIPLKGRLFGDDSNDHLSVHGGSWRRETEGSMLDRHSRVEHANFNHRVLPNELRAVVGVGVGAFLIGTGMSWWRDRDAGWKTHLKRGGVTSALATGGYIAVRGVGWAAEHFGASAATAYKFMAGAGIGLGMLVSGVMAYKRGLRGWDLAGEVAWTGTTSLASLLAAAAIKGALGGSAAGPLGALAGAAVGIVVGLVLEGVRKWWQKNDMTRKVGEWSDEGIKFLKQTSKSFLENVKNLRQTAWETTKKAAHASLVGIKKVTESLTDAIHSAGVGLKTVAQNTMHALQMVKDKITNGLGESIDLLQEQTVHGIMKAKEVSLSIIEGTKNIGDSVLDGLKSAGESIVEITKGTIHSAQEIANQCYQSVKDTANFLSNRAKKFAKNSLETLKSPFKLWRHKWA